MPNRRNFLVGMTSVLFCAPAIVRAQNIMPVKSIIIEPSINEFFSRFPQARHIGIQFIDEKNKLYGEFDSLFPGLSDGGPYYVDDRCGEFYLEKAKSLGKETANKLIKEKNDTYRKVLTPELIDEYRGFKSSNRFDRVYKNVSKVHTYGSEFPPNKFVEMFKNVKV